MTVPIYILSGFLGSGKTTLLQHMLENWKAEGKTPAVVMNEIGDVNLDGMMLGEDVAMAELLSGCICCSNRADLGTELYNLIQTGEPDVIVIEASGVANPIEILDAVTEISLYHRMELRNLITVVDAAHLWELYEQQQGKTYRLMQEQIRAASVLMINKSDLLDADRLEQVQQIARGWNPYAPMHVTVRCELDRDLYEQASHALAGEHQAPNADQLTTDEYNHHSANHDHDHNHHSDDHDHSHSHDEHERVHAPHHSHEHVMVYTHYFEQPINSEAFEALIAGLPAEIYRAKGILTFNDTNSRFLFQYAYRQSDFMKITPQKPVPDVAVFIGEHFDKRHIQELLLTLERQESEA
ncbi:CobW family GTP-binding protein [Paenibacillus sp. WLX1005]|uniref:CobW family GTP-binding protein n=1 Tax=Paenibacillus sp. WLX1005 TaxID=3243766 RepID=UPI003983E8BD